MMYENYGLFIGGAWLSPKNAAPVLSPVTEQVLGEAPAATSAETEAALDAAADGLAAWSSVVNFDRADALHRIADEMTNRADEASRMISTETGKPLAQSGREWSLACDQFRWYAEEARRIYGRTIESRVPDGQFQVSREPIGIVSTFTAWNFPAALPARKIAPALAAGCSVVLRPSWQTPGVAMVLMDCLRVGNLPPGTVNMVCGSTSETYTPIMADQRVRKVSLTGSTQVGQQMIRDAADTVKKASMELGGNAPLIIYDDADLEAALDVTVPTKYANCGQVCVTPDCFFIHESLHDAFVDGFVERASKIRLGDGLDEATTMGPLISARRLKEIDALVQNAAKAGADIVLGGKRASGFKKGHFYEPTVLTGVEDEMEVFAEENFGPVTAITSFKDDNEVITRANNSNMGLSAYAFTTSSERARQTVAKLNSGMDGINSFALAAAEAPFGGTNHSGMGREGGLEGIDDYLDTKLAQIVF